jgi:hypothetical protein
VHGKPWFRLLRDEVEALVKKKRGQGGLHRKKLEKELSGVNKETRKLKALEQRRAEVTKVLRR